jgi:transketolase
MNSRPTQSSPNSLLVEANPLVHVIPRVKTMFSHLKMHKPLTKLFERIRGVSSLDNASASNLNDPLVTTVETLQEQLNLKGDEMIILRHQLSRMKAMIQLEKREKSQARQQYRDLLAVVDAQHDERIDKLESEFNQRMEEEKRRLVEELMHIQEEEKETTKSELLQAFNQERSALLQELKDAKDACAKALESVSQLKILIKEEEEKRSQTFAEYERREGMYLKVGHYSSLVEIL